MTPGDRVILSPRWAIDFGFMDICRGVVLEPGPYQLDDELTIAIDGDGRGSFYYVKTVYLRPEGDDPDLLQTTPGLVQAMPVDSQARKDVPVTTGVFDYFPAALAYIARVSKAGNDKHNPGEPLHHARGKSTDHADCILRHLADRGLVDADTGMRHTAEMAWRALALLQEELEAAGAPLPRGAWDGES